ncbi:MurR/RpiR family transcriptional regulator [Sinorhizobium meliloti]|uniref:MurR/RpiR family transcriptional regulator n=1 Tax=Rhizobium meliloti TaxID=382 RepID=UPI00299D2691|nr:MurR/RpiR family transcriptional regulator [Sinorhizobium meliloti]MDW9906689.1 MurR/RpiR family transcriptional regulator [Sinorhizobium meliloti]MDW9920257.1 MurR/RpiR family transcriptional regulator [Sinorhizobium meliloti]MDW9968924.1 MurR/RpiR family transcriptional regulator [Sinorhizobium meliloti]MDW9974574.1 MurR/RpiR family transcriptional regulator [Sinorhizobium meliloti]
MALLSATADEEKADRKAMSCRCGRMPPSNLRELKAMIAKKQVVFPGERKRVMRAILDHPEIIAFGTATSIAAACGVSSATVVRLAGHLGFRKFRDFKNLFRDHLKETRALQQQMLRWRPRSR